MTIQEVERQSGMTRANIRFYEEKGLLTPAAAAQRLSGLFGGRCGNAAARAGCCGRWIYRSIPSARCNRASARWKLCWLSASGTGTTPRAAPGMQEALCQRMRQDGAQYATLDAEKYLHPRLRRSGCYLLPGRRISALCLYAVAQAVCI